MKKLIGYRKLENGIWYQYPPTLTKDNVIKFKDKIVCKSKELFNNVKLKVA